MGAGGASLCAADGGWGVTMGPKSFGGGSRGATGADGVIGGPATGDRCLGGVAGGWGVASAGGGGGAGARASGTGRGASLVDCGEAGDIMGPRSLGGIRGTTGPDIWPPEIEASRGVSLGGGLSRPTEPGRVDEEATGEEAICGAVSRGGSTDSDGPTLPPLHLGVGRASPRTGSRLLTAAVGALDLGDDGAGNIVLLRWRSVAS